MAKLAIPGGTTEAQWLAAAEDALESYGGDAVRLVAQMMVSHEYQQTQIAYLQAQVAATSGQEHLQGRQRA